MRFPWIGLRMLPRSWPRDTSQTLRRYVVVTGATAQVQASMNLLGRHAEDLIVRESQQDWRRYVDAMHSAAKPGERHAAS